MSVNPYVNIFKRVYRLLIIFLNGLFVLQLNLVFMLPIFMELRESKFLGICDYVHTLQSAER